MNAKELKEIIENHGAWLSGEGSGQRANLEGANLRDANLLGANLRDANLLGANLRDDNLRDAIRVIIEKSPAAKCEVRDND
jgi:uncharacterized protein YjbI with pentapeptide repeats